MNIQEIHIAFDQEVDKTQDFEFPSFLPEQKDYWLNKAYEKYVRETAYPIIQGKIPFEQTQKRIDDLREIVIESTPLIPTIISTRYSVILPSDYNHLVRHECNTSSGRVSGIISNQDKINIQKKDPFWKSIPSEPLYYILGNTLVYDNNLEFPITATYLTYIKKLTKMRLGTQYTIPTTDINCEISSEYVQHKIIDIAVSMVLENIESQRYQTNLNELNNTD